MAKTARTNKKHYSTPAEKSAQRRRTRANKIKKLTFMIGVTPGMNARKRLVERLEHWENQQI